MTQFRYLCFRNRYFIENGGIVFDKEGKVNVDGVSRKIVKSNSEHGTTYTTPCALKFVNFDRKMWDQEIAHPNHKLAEILIMCGMFYKFNFVCYYAGDLHFYEVYVTKGVIGLPREVKQLEASDLIFAVQDVIGASPFPNAYASGLFNMRYYLEKHKYDLVVSEDKEFIREFCLDLWRLLKVLELEGVLKMKETKEQTVVFGEELSLMAMTYVRKPSSRLSLSDIRNQLTYHTIRDMISCVGLNWADEGFMGVASQVMKERISLNPLDVKIYCWHSGNDFTKTGQSARVTYSDFEFQMGRLGKQEIVAFRNRETYQVAVMILAGKSYWYLPCMVLDW